MVASISSSRNRLIGVLSNKPELWERIYSNILLKGITFGYHPPESASSGQNTSLIEWALSNSDRPGSAELWPMCSLELLHNRYVIIFWASTIRYFVGEYPGPVYKTITSVISSVRSRSRRGQFVNRIYSGNIDLNDCLTIPVLATYMLRLKRNKKVPLEPNVMEIATTGDEEIDSWLEDKIRDLSGPLESLEEEQEVPKEKEDVVTGPIRVIRI